MFDDLIIWVLIVGIALLALSGGMLVFNVMNNKSSLIASITLVCFAIFFSFVGVSCVAAFIVVALLGAFIDIAASTLLIATSATTIAGTILGGAIALRYHGKQRNACSADPECNLY